MEIKDLNFQNQKLFHSPLSCDILQSLTPSLTSPYSSPFHYLNTSKSVFGLNYRLNKNIFFKFAPTPIKRVITAFAQAISNQLNENKIRIIY